METGQPLNSRIFGNPRSCGGGGGSGDVDRDNGVERCKEERGFINLMG